MRKGFTLIEVLIVIAIIAVLAGILFPMLGRAKDSGFETSALSNIKQIGTALAAYNDDHDGMMLPSTNYGVPDKRADKIWTNVIEPEIKSAQVFIAPGSNGQFADSWSKRGWATIGYNASTALDRSQGCRDDIADPTSCIAFKTVVNATKLDPAMSALLAVTPAGEVEDRYLGYEFSPYNGAPNTTNPQMTPPLVSDRDLVKEFPAGIPAEMIKPVFARYLATGSDDGQTPIAFLDTHAKSASAKQIMAGNSTFVWRLR